LKNRGINQFQADLIENRYHIFNLDYAKIDGYYPDELLAMINTSGIFEGKIKIGEQYSVRAFFSISEPFDDQVEFESGFLDLRLIMKEGKTYIAEVVTELPPRFVLKKGSKIKIEKKNILYKPKYR